MNYLLPIRSIMFILIFTIGSYITKNKLNDISNWWSIVATVSNIITIIILVFVARKMNISYKKLINYEKGKTKVKDVIIISLIVLLIGTSGMYLAGYICYHKFPYAAPMMIEPIPLILAVINFIALPLTVSFAEDGLYLGCGVNSFKNKYIAILVPAFFYALQHCFVPTLWDIRYIIYRFLSFMPLTIILCSYYYKKRNPLPIMIGHTIIELASVIMILMTTINPEFYQMMIKF